MSWICSRCRTRFEEPRDRCPHDARRVVEDLTGRTLADRYTLRELLGVGGMDSSVWLAWQTSIQRSVAIKMLPPASEEAAARFARGARIASNLNHPNITVVHDYGRTDSGELYLVMELLEGRTLHQELRKGPMPIERALRIINQVLRALDHAHRKNVVHRDIKPGNLFLTPRNDDPDFVKVLDFGIARYIDDIEDQNGDDHEITQTRQICGTPQYMAPEQVAFGQVDARTDLYALGVVLYRMLTDRLPFPGKTHHEIFLQHLHEPPPPFSTARPDLSCPPEVEALVMRALAKAASDRFASAAEMRTTLNLLRGRLGLNLDPEESSSMNSPSGAMSLGALPLVLPKPNRRGLFFGLGGVAAALAGAALLYTYWPRPEPAAPPSPETALKPAPRVEPPAPPVAPDASLAQLQDAALPKPKPVEIVSQPAGARVEQNGQLLGLTPLELNLPRGPHEVVVVAAGHSPSTIHLEVGDTKIRQHVRLLPATTRSARRPRDERAEPPKPAEPPTPIEPTIPIEPPKPAEPPKATKPAEPKVKLLGDGAPSEPKTGGGPAVRLLTD